MMIQPSGPKQRRSTASRVMPILLALAICCAAACGLHLRQHPQALSTAPSIQPTAGQPTGGGQEQNSFNAKAAADALQRYITLNLSEQDLHKGDLLLVNNQVACQFVENDELVSLYDVKSTGYSVRDIYVQISQRIAAPLNELLDGFYAQTGLHTINVISGYRTQEFQQQLLDERTQTDGAVEAAKWVAQPGGSEHHTGLAVDLGLVYDGGSTGAFDGEGAYRWIAENASRYGFILRYQADKQALTGIYEEPWHFRYVGIPHAYVMEQNGLCLEEYIDYLRQFEAGTQHLAVQYAGRSYEIYYAPGTDVPVPEDQSYTLSGNNVDGFIVTVAL